MRRFPAALIMAAAPIPSPGKRGSLSAKAIVSCLILLHIHSGCVTSRIASVPPTPPPYGNRASFGTVGVARARYPPKTDIDVLAKGRLAGAGAGAAAFFVFTLLILLEDLPNPDDSSQVKWWLGSAFAALPVGAVYGAITAMPGEEAASCELLVRKIPRRTSPQEDLQGEVLRAGAEGAANRLFPVDEVGPKRIDDIAAYDTLEGNGIQTVLEISVERIALKADKNGSGPPLALIMDARSRLIRLRDRTVVDVHKFRHSSTPRKFAEWAADNAALLDKEYGDGVRKLALDIVNWNLPGKNGTE